MEIMFAQRVLEGENGIFNILNEKKAKLKAQGREIFDLSIGTPDFPPPPHVVEALVEAGKNAENYKYAISDLPKLIEAVQGHYQRRFDVSLEKTEIMSVNGSQEGIAHISFTLCDEGDIVLIPDPGYPIFRDGPTLSGAKVYTYPLVEEHGFMPDLKKIQGDIARKAKVMIVSYPMNPLGVIASDDFYRELIEFAKENEIIIIHDNAYSDIVFGGKRGSSFLAFEGAKEVGVEFYSLSKSYNLTGSRISFAAGNSSIIKRFKEFRSKIDYGVFLPIQYAAIAALEGDQSFVERQCRIYEARAKKLCGGLRQMEWQVPDSKGSMFVWAPIPKGFENSVDFCDKLMEASGVICTPGNSFGELGEGYVRFALVVSEKKIEEALLAIEQSGVLRNSVML